MGNLNMQQSNELGAEQIGDLLDDNSAAIEDFEEEDAMLAAFGADDEEDEFAMPLVDGPDADDAELQQAAADDLEETITQKGDATAAAKELDKDLGSIDDNPEIIPLDADPKAKAKEDKPELTEMQLLEQRLTRQQAGKMGELIAQIKTLEKNQQAPAEDKKAAPTAEQLSAALENDDDMKMLVDEFPEFASALDKKLAAQAAGFEEKIAAMGSGQSAEDVSAMIASHLNVAKQENIIATSHPNYLAVTAGAHFNAWVRAQPLDVQQVANNSDDGAEIVSLLDNYGAFVSNEQGKVSRQRSSQERLRSNIPATASRSTGKTDTVDDAEDAFNAGFNG